MKKGIDIVHLKVYTKGIKRKQGVHGRDSGRKKVIMYDYMKEMVADVKEAIEYDYNLAEWTGNRSGLEEQLCDDLWIDDSVTGNASGSYTFNRYQAQQYVCDNVDLCREALKEFCVEAETIADKFLNEDFEYFDVTIRCYLLGQAISEALDDLGVE